MNFKCLKDHVEMTTLYKPMNILIINDNYELEVAKFIHSYNQKRFPENFMSFKPTNQFHSYQTRSVTNENYYNKNFYICILLCLSSFLCLYVLFFFLCCCLCKISFILQYRNGQFCLDDREMVFCCLVQL